MTNILSDVTPLPLSCKSAAERTARELEKEDAYADLSEGNRRKLTELEQVLSKETGENIALVAYRI